MVNTAVCQIQIALLGPFHLVVDQEDVDIGVWKSKKAFTMLKYLAARQGQRVSTDMLIEVLWPDNADIDSIRNLHTAVWYARRMLTSKEHPDADSLLRYANGSYWLELSDGCLDLDLFNHHVQRARQLTATDPEMALFHCEAALELYRDDFLVNDIYEEWTIPYREDYQELYFEMVTRSAQLLIEHRKDPQAAIDICRQGVKRDQFREELYQMGIKAYIYAERYVDAINLYDRYSKMLMDEFQLEPSKATTELIAQLKTANEKKPILGSELVIELPTGPQLCSREALQFVINAELRRLKRKGNEFSLLLVANKEESHRNKHLEAAFHVLQRSLRGSDLLCQHSSNLVVVFLPDTKARESKIVLQRLRQALRHALAENKATLSFTLLDSEYMEEMEKNLVSIFDQ